MSFRMSMFGSAVGIFRMMCSIGCCSGVVLFMIGVFTGSANACVVLCWFMTAVRFVCSVCFMGCSMTAGSVAFFVMPHYIYKVDCCDEQTS